MFGFLNIDKPVGITSHDVVSRLRRVLKIKQIGHTGTLDPFASGVLPVAIGKATRLIEYLSDDKAYIATVKFGVETDTYDVEGQVLSTSDKKVLEDEVKRALKFFEGEIEQIPPIYSAIKVKGKKLYEYARAGEEVKLEPRKVVINKIELKSFDFENQVAQVYVECSKGTYIRSIAHDLGEKLSCGGHLIELKRVKAGKFFIEKSIALDDIVVENVGNYLIKPDDVIELFKMDLNEEENIKISHGQFLRNKTSLKEDENLILLYNGNIKSIACVSGDKIKVKKVF